MIALRTYLRFFVFASVFLLGCSKKNNEFSSKYFTGVWSGYVTNINNKDAQKLSLFLDSEIPKVESDIISSYKYILLQFEGENVEEGDMLIILHNSSPSYPIASIVLHPAENGTMAAIVDIIDKGQYRGTLYRVSNSI